MNEPVQNQKKSSMGFHIMAKPIGPACNLNCTYCFYLEKEALYPAHENYRMSEEVLEAYVRKTCAYLKGIPEVLFAWQGGEPTLMGLDFFRRAVELQEHYAGGKRVVNTLQTNGTLLNDEWCRFLAEHDFLIGLSLDGPEDLHNRFRIDRGGKPTFDVVMRALGLLKKHRVEFNVLCCVTKESTDRHLDIYHFFKDQGVKYIQFIPIIERIPDSIAKSLGLSLSSPPDPYEKNDDVPVTPWTVEPKKYGDFLINIFDEWVRNDVGSIFVMNFDWAFSSWVFGNSPACCFSKRCGRAVIIEHNGDIYSCDHFMYPKYRLGNILEKDLPEMLESSRQTSFGALKETALPRYCKECDALFACRGECPKHRFVKTPEGEPGLNYLCAAYKKYFRHIHKYMRVMAQLLENDLPVSYVMEAVKGPLVIRKD
jgi:uncharacterized protein